MGLGGFPSARENLLSIYFPFSPAFPHLKYILTDRVSISLSVFLILWGCTKMGEECVDIEKESESGRGVCVAMDTPERKHQLTPPVSKFEVIYYYYYFLNLKLGFCLFFFKI